MSERFDINVNVIEGGISKTKNPQNTTSTSMTGESQKLSLKDAEQQLQDISIPDEDIADTPSDASLGLGTYALGGLALVSGAANFAADYVGSSYSIRGADYKAIKLSHNMDQVNTGVGLAASIGAGALVGGPIGAGIAGIGYIAKKAWDVAANNREYLKEIQTSKIESDYYTSRVRQNISERR